MTGSEGFSQEEALRASSATLRDDDEYQMMVEALHSVDVETGKPGPSPLYKGRFVRPLPPWYVKERAASSYFRRFPRSSGPWGLRDGVDLVPQVKTEPDTRRQESIPHPGNRPVD